MQYLVNVIDSRSNSGTADEHVAIDAVREPALDRLFVPPDPSTAGLVAGGGVDGRRGRAATTATRTSTTSITAVPILDRPRRAGDRVSSR